MNREKLAWLISLILISILAFQLPGTLARREDEYAFVKTQLDIRRVVNSNYVEPVDQAKLQGGAINGMMGELDPYSIYVPPAKKTEFDNLLEGSFEGVGIELQVQPNGDIEVVSPIPDSPAMKAGVMAGDIITHVNGQDVKGLKIEDVQKLIKGPLGSEVRITVRHLDGTEKELKMPRQQIIMPTVMGYRRDVHNNWDFWVSRQPRIAYIRITQFTNDTFPELKKALDQVLPNLQGLILDVRFNPGGMLDQAEKVVNLFVPTGTIVWTEGLHRPKEVAMANPADALPQRFPMVVLVNEHSASAAEIVSGSLKDNHRALIVGTRTFGKGSVQEIFPMPRDGGGELKLTVAYYYLPSGRLVHRRKGATDWGVDPQIVVPMTEEQQERVLQAQGEQELFRKPLPPTHPTTGPGATTGPATGPATQPVVDVQLQEAVSAMASSILLHPDQEVPSVPATRPTTEPATVPSER